ncbi:MAG TPA: hypothetical protein PLD95_02095 [bacterium]|jgi:multisubunit Na+/H+ antiporter MnhG subunit|nr:MAG: hypothetical protein BWX59_02451 [Bacteroidetes bacterium ADurb.Bin028]HOG38240.1 hypothetical protein [bacterium]
MKKIETLGTILLLFGISCFVMDIELFGIAWSILSLFGSVCCISGIVILIKTTLK